MRRLASAMAFVFFGSVGVAHAGVPVKLYVSAGGPVANAVVTVDGHRADARTSRDGFIVVDVDRKSTKVDIVARGGHVGKTPVRGSLHAIVPHPFQRDDEDLYVDPVSTIVAAYLVARPGTVERIARERVRALLGINERADTERALRHRPRYFDGLRWLRYANTHGGVDAYARRLALRIDRRHGTVTFINPELDTSLDFVRTAGSVMGIVSGTFSIANDILNWTQSPQPTNGQIYSTVQDIKSQLDGITSELSTIESTIQTDFATVNTKIDGGQCTDAFDKIATVAAEVQSANEDWEDLVNNATAGKTYSATHAQADLADLQSNMKDVNDAFESSDDKFHDALLPDTLAPTTPMLSLCATYLQDLNNQFLTPAISASLDRLETYVMGWQAIAFNLIVSYWSQGEPAGTPITQVEKLSDAVDLYLGLSDQADWNAWVAAENGELYLSTVGDLFTEIDLTAGIDDVPAGTVIDPSGRMWSDTTDYSAGTFGEMPEALDMSTYVPNNAPCDFLADYNIDPGGDTDNSPFFDNTIPACNNLFSGFTKAQSDVTSSLNPLIESTGFYDWNLAGTPDLSALAAYPTSTSLIHGPNGVAWNTLTYWDGETWCLDDGVEAPDCLADGSYDFDQITVDDDLRACQSPKSSCYPATGFCDSEHDCFGVVDEIEIPVTVSGTTADTRGIRVDGGTTQPSNLYRLPFRDPQSNEKYRP